MKNKKNIAYYLDLPWTYTIEIGKDDKGGKIYIVEVNELPGICTDAPTFDEAMVLIKEAITSAVRLYMKLGEDVPEPINEETFKGNIAYRTSTKRHYLLAKEALKKKLSLSKLIDEYIDSALTRSK
jgi:predicted RNase H-like HicB family nuclease